MSAVTAWTMGANHRRHYVRGVAGYVADRLGARDARLAYRAMRKSGIEPWDARRHVVLLLGAKATFTKQGES